MNYKYKLLVKFKYSNKEFFIIKVQSQKIIFLIRDNKKIRFNFTEEETEIFAKVYNSLIITKKTSIFLETKKIENKYYKIFYDYNNKLHYWFEVENGKLKQTNEKINCFFNLKYNHISATLYEEHEGMENEEEDEYEDDGENFFARVLEIARKVVIVTVAAEISIFSLATYSIANGIRQQSRNPFIDFYNNSQNETISEQQTIVAEKDYKDKLKERELRPYNYEEIRTAIESNAKIGEQEKKLLYNMKFLFDENHQYMDIDTIIERLKTLEIAYTTENKGSTSGEYVIPENKITIYNVEEFKYEKLSTITHELLHVFQVGGAYNRLTSELSNELTSREVLRRMHEMGIIENVSCFRNSLGVDLDYGVGYDRPMSIEYLFAELFTQEQLQQYQFFPDEKIIIDALVSIENESIEQDNNEEIRVKAYMLLDTIDEFRQYDEKGNSIMFFTNELYKKAYNQINYYYKKLYNKPMEENLAVDFMIWNRKLIKYSDTGLLSDEKTKATNETMLEIVKNLNSEDIEDHMFDSWVYTFPRTYLTDVHKYPICMYCLGAKDRFVSFKIDENVEMLFWDNLMEEKAKVSEERY